jgi:hypothetical protein
MCSGLVRLQSRSNKGRTSVHDRQRDQFLRNLIFAPHTAAPARGLIGARNTRIQLSWAPLQVLVIREGMHDYSRCFTHLFPLYLTILRSHCLTATTLAR